MAKSVHMTLILTTTSGHRHIYTPTHPICCTGR
jgi:hypothetical protein